MPFFRQEHMTCTSHTINTTRPLDSGSLDTMKYELYSSWWGNCDIEMMSSRVTLQQSENSE